MGLNTYHFKNLDFRVSNSDYWDIFLSSDETQLSPYNGILTGDSLVTYFDFNNSDTFTTGNTNIYSLSTWTGATVDPNGLILNNIGLVGIDNGLITYIKPSGDTENTALLSALTGSSLILLSSDTGFWMHEVTGLTNNYIYPINLTSEPLIGQYAQLCGGFYQGFYKLDGYNYQTLPNRMHKGWVAEFWLNKQNLCSGYTGTTLNDDFPNNKGFFFFIGTRSENKFWDFWKGNNTGSTINCTFGCTEWCTIPKETGMTTSSGIPLDPPKLFIDEIDNKFLIFSRTSNHTSCGCQSTDDKFPHNLNACNFTASSITITSTTVYTEAENQFLIYNRASHSTSTCGCQGGQHTGFTACDYTGRTTQINPLNWSGDVVDNAVGFRIKDDGSIGYRRLSYTCTSELTSGITVEESYSLSGLVQDNVWTHIAVRFIADRTLTDECELLNAKPRNGKLMFYINGKLKHIIRHFKEVVPRELDDHKEKQQTVPYNISIGGGSQGLLESQTFDGPDPYDSNLLIEENFAGTFIGGISQFRYYGEELSWCDIKNNYEEDAGRYGHNITCPCCGINSNLGIYYGKLNNANISIFDLGSLNHNSINNVINTYINIPSGSGYGYLLIPDILSQPNQFFDGTTVCGLPFFSIPYVVLPDLIISGITYKIYRTFYSTSAAFNMRICG